MFPLKNSTRVAVAVALFVPIMFSLWMIAVPGTIATSTFAVLTALIAAFGAIVLKTYNDGQTAGSLGQLLHETELAPASIPVTGTSDTRQTRSQR